MEKLLHGGGGKLLVNHLFVGKEDLELVNHVLQHGQFA